MSSSRLGQSEMTVPLTVTPTNPHLDQKNRDDQSFHSHHHLPDSRHQHILAPLAAPLTKPTPAVLAAHQPDDTAELAVTNSSGAVLSSTVFYNEPPVRLSTTSRLSSPEGADSLGGSSTASFSQPPSPAHSVSRQQSSRSHRMASIPQQSHFEYHHNERHAYPHNSHNHPPQTASSSRQSSLKSKGSTKSESEASTKHERHGRRQDRDTSARPTQPPPSVTRSIRQPLPVTMTTTYVYDEDDLVDDIPPGLEEKTPRILLFLSLLFPPLSALCAAYTLFVTLFILITAPLIALCTTRPPLADQLASSLAPVLRFQLAKVYAPLPPKTQPDTTHHTSSTSTTSTSNPKQPTKQVQIHSSSDILKLISVLISAPFVSAALALAAWVAGVFWAYAAMLGDPDCRESLDSGSGGGGRSRSRRRGGGAGSRRRWRNADDGDGIMIGRGGGGESDGVRTVLKVWRWWVGFLRKGEV